MAVGFAYSQFTKSLKFSNRCLKSLRLCERNQAISGWSPQQARRLRRSAYRSLLRTWRWAYHCEHKQSSLGAGPGDCHARKERSLLRTCPLMSCRQGSWHSAIWSARNDKTSRASRLTNPYSDFTDFTDLAWASKTFGVSFSAPRGLIPGFTRKFSQKPSVKSVYKALAR